MQVILLEKIGRLGNLGDKVTIKPGYGRNYLMPQGKAIPATKDNITKFETRRAELEKAAAETLAKAQKRAEALEKVTASMQARAADEGRLYGSVGTKELAAAITAAGVAVEKSEIRLPNGAIRTLGEHEVTVQLHGDVSVPVKVMVTAEA